jgi:hypothetical protein
MRLDSNRKALLAVLLVAVLAYVSACDTGREEPSPPTDERPALSDEKIRETLFDAWVEEVPDETGVGRPITWYFQEDEPTEIVVVDRQMDGDKATILVDVATRTAPRSRSPKVLSGRIRLYYELQPVLFLRKWRVVNVDNVSMTYRDEPKADGDKADADRPPNPPSPPAKEPRKGSS